MIKGKILDLLIKFVYFLVELHLKHWDSVSAETQNQMGPKNPDRDTLTFNRLVSVRVQVFMRASAGPLFQQQPQCEGRRGGSKIDVL